jgi:hypothetical protein
MISATHRTDALHALESPTVSSPSASHSTSSFGRELASAVEGHLNQSGKGAEHTINGSELKGQASDARQFLVTLKPEISNSVKPIASGPSTATTSTSTTTSTSPSNASAATTASNIPTMLGMGPVAGTAPVQQIITTQAAVSTTPVSEVDAYWNAQPKAVQALRNMPDGEDKDQLALNLANQGYSIDTQIMVWGWDPQMTMTMRANEGYSWVPSYGQANIPVGPGLSMPEDPTQYNPGNPPAGAIQVSTAFAVGTVQNPLVQPASANS